MSDCDACAEALKNPFTGLLTAGCHGCSVRAVSNAPRDIRSRYYLTIPDIDARLQFMRNVHEEHERRRALTQRIRSAA